MRTRQQYYWIVTRDPETRQPYLVYGGLTENTARQKGLEILGGVDFEIKMYPTKDMRTASAFLRGKRLESTHSLEKSSRRIGHDRSLKRLFRKNQS